MSAIVDMIYAKSEQLAVLVRKYPECHLEERDYCLKSQVYLLFLPGVSEESYFDFLIENALAMSSTSFLRRYHGDEYARMVMSRLAESAAGQDETGGGQQCGEV
ncbi:MAG TPA: hypothetical protein VJ550_04335 [Geomonas sp.]|nr:hypothetical protein [Geomonas sp.]